MRRAIPAIPPLAASRRELLLARFRILLVGRRAADHSRLFSGGPLRIRAALVPLFLAGLLLAAAGCGPNETGTGSFDRTLTVNGPVVLDIANGSGKVEITPGASGEVRIHGAFRVSTWPWERPQDRVAQISQHPPIEQSGTLIRIGHVWSRMNVVVDYTIEVPVETEVRGVVGSGELNVRGIRGPAKLVAGSGEITAERIAEDTQAVAGSGDLHLCDINGEAQATAGSGDLQLTNVHGAIRANTGSGDVSIEHAGGDIIANTGSGDINLRDIVGDLRIKAGSGDVTVDGNPAANSYWEFHTSSGSVTLRVPSNASFRFYAHSSSGSIDTGLPMTIEERPKHELRAHVGDGKARIDVNTASGDIRVD